MMSMPDPQPSGGFEWAQAPWGRILRCGPLLPYADHFFTAASLTLREAPEEWAAVARLAGVSPERLLLLHQVHGRTIVTADADRPGGWTREEADGIIGRDASCALVVRVADCAPILMADTKTGAVAAVHAGWRSTVQRIAAAALDALRASFGTDPRDVVAAIGPSLGACCGEMGEEVVQAFRDAGHDDGAIARWFIREPGRRPHFDLWRANREQLEQTGVPPDAIHVAGLCTRTHSDVFHSYRAAGPGAGRMAGVIRANPGSPPPV
jgi:polyphenol oxidase